MTSPPDATPSARPILAFDASGDACAVALLADGYALSRTEAMSRGHGERLIPMIEELLAEADLGWPQIGLIAVARGPGSFTGVRVAVAAARGFALALDRPAVGVDVDVAIAAAYAADQDQNAASDRVAVCLGRGSRLIWRGHQCVQGRAALTDAGEGAPPADWPVLIGPAAELADPARTRPGFDAVDPLVLARCAEATAAGAPAVTPLYLRPPDAEPSRSRPPPRLDAGGSA